MKRDIKETAEDFELCAIQQAENLVEEVRRISKLRVSVLLAWIDVQKAYDRIWRNGLLHQMKVDEFSTWILKLLFSCLPGGGSKFESAMKEAKEGLPQE